MGLLIWEDTKSQNYNPTYGMVRKAPGDTSQAAVSISGTSAQSEALGAGVNIVTLQADVDCRVTFGANPTATSGHAKLFADEFYDFWVGDLPLGTKIAVIQA